MMPLAIFQMVFGLFLFYCATKQPNGAWGWFFLYLFLAVVNLTFGLSYLIA